MPSDFIEEHFSEFAKFIRNHNFKIKAKLYSPEVFGSAYAELLSDNLKIKITQDRGDIFVELKSVDDTNWHSLEYVLDYVGFGDLTKGLTVLPEVSHLITGLESKFSEIKNILCSSGELKKFELFESNKRKQMRQKILSKNE